jgi:hypothetical protein
MPTIDYTHGLLLLMMPTLRVKCFRAKFSSFSSFSNFCAAWKDLQDRVWIIHDTP